VDKPSDEPDRDSDDAPAKEGEADGLHLHGLVMMRRLQFHLGQQSRIQSCPHATWILPWRWLPECVLVASVALLFQSQNAGVAANWTVGLP
jgi:hypothetical protein